VSETLTALASENLNPSLRSLLEDVQRGHIRVPRFQRPFVWTDAQRLELLRSIRDNMPIGSLLVWRTLKFQLACFPTVGPHAIPPVTGIAPTTGWQYLLDGHQRVSTLLGLLLQPTHPVPVEQSSDEDAIDWDIQYDLLEEDFVFGGKTGRKSTARPLLPLWTLFDGRLVNRRMREMRRQGEREGWTNESLDTWEERADQLSYRFQQYRIPIVVMVTDDLKLATRTFQRINSPGTPMDEAHLVAALTWTAEFDLRERLDELRVEFPSGWHDIEEGLFLQVCKGLAGLDMTKAGQTELVKKIQEDPTLLQRAGEGLARAMELLSRGAAVVRQELLPYAFQVVLLAVELDRWKGMTPPEHAFLGWFWRTCWSESFASATYRQVQSEHGRLRDVLDKDTTIAWTRDRDLPDRFDFRLARVRLFTLRLATRSQLVDAYGQPVEGRALLITHGREALVRLFPVPRRASPSLKKLLQGAGNRFFIDPGSDADFRARLKSGPDLTADALRAHFVDAEAQAALRRGNLEEFIARRARAMNEWDLAEWKAEGQAAGDAAPI
jgi:hypothetical protein